MLGSIQTHSGDSGPASCACDRTTCQLTESWGTRRARPNAFFSPSYLPAENLVIRVARQHAETAATVCSLCHGWLQLCSHFAWECNSLLSSYWKLVTRSQSTLLSNIIINTGQLTILSHVSRNSNKWHHGGFSLICSNGSNMLYCVLCNSFAQFWRKCAIFLLYQKRCVMKKNVQLILTTVFPMYV